MTTETAKCDRHAGLAVKLMWIPVCVLIAGQLYLILFGNWMSWYVSFYSIGVGAILAIGPMVFGILAIVGKTRYKRHAILAITIPILTVALSCVTFGLFGI